MGKLTDLQIRNLVKAGDPISGLSDGGNLYFTLSKKGTAAWIFRYRFGGKQREFTIGRYPDISLSEARRIAIGLRNDVNEGQDIALEKQLRKQAEGSLETLDVFVYKYLNDQTHLKHPKIPRQRYEKHVKPKLGNLPIRRITAPQIYELLQDVKHGVKGKSKPARTVANDLLRFLNNVFDLAVVLEKIPFNPAAAFTNKQAGGKESPRQRSLELDEITTFFNAMKNTSTLGRENELALKLLLVLCVRKNELVQARWDEFNLDAKLWRLPIDRTKSSKAFRIPLPGITVEWLRELKVRAYQSEYVFPARRIQNKNRSRNLPHISPDTLNAGLKKVSHNLEHFTIHDLRRTARTHLARLGTEPHVAELCLNHKLKGLPGIYDTFEYFEERKEALNKWAGEIEKIDFGNVISIERATKLKSA